MATKTFSNDLIQRIEESASLVDMKLPIALGLKEDGAICYRDLTTLHHLLIAGATGQGKTSCLNGIIVSLLKNKLNPELVLISTIENELCRNQHSHGPITEPKAMMCTLEKLNEEMEIRFKLFKEEGVSNLEDYNIKVEDALRHIVVVIDGFDHFFLSPDNKNHKMESLIIELAKFGFRVGIHLIISTQRVTSNVITGFLKANFSARIAFRVVTEWESRIILDSLGANELDSVGKLIFSYRDEFLHLQGIQIEYEPERGNMSIYSRNEKLLEDWEKASNGEDEEDFAEDGILYRGEIKYDNNGECIHLKSGNEGEAWEHSPKRILYVTKELNAERGGAWDIRSETCRKKENGEDKIKTNTRFHANYLYQIYGLGHTTPEGMMAYKDFSDKEAMNYFDASAIARINVKKRAGKSSIKDDVLQEYINKYKDFIIKQIKLLDADIIVSCGKVIFNFIRENCYNLEKVNDWIYYCSDLNKVVINSWHPSYRFVSLEDFYNEMIGAYYKFLQSHPDFVNPHR